MTDQQYGLLVEARIGARMCRVMLQEKAYRIAASRAYYCMFYVAQALLLDRGLSFSKHSAVVAAFAKHFTQTGQVEQEYHRNLKRAQVMRGTADYDQIVPIDPATVESLVVQAERFVDLGERLLGPVTEHEDE